MSETESDDDLMPNNGLQYLPNSRAVNANTTNLNITNQTNYTFKTNMKTSTFNTADLQRQRYDMGGFNQRSMYYRRETSPISLRSFPDSRIQNTHSSFYARGMSSQRSVYNGRSGSPMSMRSIDSNASVSAADIALAFKNVKFNKYDLRLITEAYNQFVKKKQRRRIEKRRNLKLFLKRNRQKYGDDSGDQGSDSSISSDDCRSTRTFYKENIPSTTTTTIIKDLSNFRNTIRESEMIRDCTDNIRQNSLKNKFAVNNTINHNYSTSTNTRLENTLVPLKERFTKGSSFLLPSQRFNINKSIANAPNNHIINNKQTNIINNKKVQCTSKATNSHETDSDNEEIFSEVTMRTNIQNNSSQRKRTLDNDENNTSAKKRKKIELSPIKHNDTQQSDFNFKKPLMPVRKPSNIKKSVQEVLIAKSQQPLTDSIHLDIPMSNDSDKINSQRQELPQNSTELVEPSNQKDVTQNSDVSMRPSFIKRKLFTQKLDVAEKKNTSSDKLSVNSPQTKLYSECGEKNKVRKLVTSQSCLSRDVMGNDNVLDLIHKIVPPEKMNLTSASNKKETSKRNRNSNDNWDVFSVISMCDENEGSDTYTDEEIFKAPTNLTVKKTNTKESKNVNKINKPKDVETKEIQKDCKVVVEKLPPKVYDSIPNKAESSDLKCPTKRTVSMCVKSFWDTDFESDMEDRIEPPWKRHQPQQAKNNSKDTTVCSNFNLNSTRNASKGTILTVRSLKSKNFNSSRSDISRVSTRKPEIQSQEQKEDNNNVPMKKSLKPNQNNNEEKIQEIKKSQSKEPKSSEKNKTPKAKSVPLKEKNNNNSKVSNKTKKQELKNSKSRSDIKCNEKTKVENGKPKIKAANVVVKNNNIKENKLNVTRESLRLKQKKEKNNSSLNDAKLMLSNTSPDKNTAKIKQTNKKSDIPKPAKKPSKNTTLNRKRQTPRKLNEKKQRTSSLADQSSFNVSNISDRSLRIRQKIIK